MGGPLNQNKGPMAANPIDLQNVIDGLAQPDQQVRSQFDLSSPMSSQLGAMGNPAIQNKRWQEASQPVWQEASQPAKSPPLYFDQHTKPNASNGSIVNNIRIPRAPQSGMQRLSPGVYRNNKGALVSNTGRALKRGR